FGLHPDLARRSGLEADPVDVFVDVFGVHVHHRLLPSGCRRQVAPSRSLPTPSAARTRIVREPDEVLDGQAAMPRDRSGTTGDTAVDGGSRHRHTTIK